MTRRRTPSQGFNNIDEDTSVLAVEEEQEEEVEAEVEEKTAIESVVAEPRVVFDPPAVQIRHPRNIPKFSTTR